LHARFDDPALNNMKVIGRARFSFDVQ